MYKSSICLLCKDENEYLNEWLEWHLNIGFEHFYIYDNNSKIPLEKSVLEKYKEYCTFIDFDCTLDKYYNIQSICYCHCLKEFGDDNEWIAFIDTDEFIRLYLCDNINVFLKDFNECEGIFIEWIIYNADGQVEKNNKPVKERFKKTIKFPFKDQVYGKCIVKPKYIKRMSAHFPIGSYNSYIIVDSDFNRVKTPYVNENTIPINKIVIEHYITRSYEEWIEKINRGSLTRDFERKLDEFFIFNEDMRWLSES